MDPRLLEAARKGYVVMLNELAIGNGDSLLQTTAGKNTALHIAAKYGHYEFGRGVFDRHPSLLLQPNSKGDTPLHVAVRAGQLLLVEYFCAPIIQLQLESNGNESNCLFKMKNRHGNTALHEAARSCNVEVIAKLMKADGQVALLVNKNGDSPLFLAAEKGSLKAVMYLLSYGGGVGCGGRGGRTALHAACQNYDIAKEVINKRPELTQKQDESGSTPLHYIASTGNLRMMKLLLHHDPSTTHLSDANGLSPLHVAAAMGHVDLIAAILDISPESYELVDINGRNFLHHAVVHKNKGVIKYVLENPALGGLLNEMDDGGLTPLHLAVSNRSQEVVHMLLTDKRVATDVRCHDGWTPLDLASLQVESSVGLRMCKIMRDLNSVGSKSTPQRLDLINKKPKRNHEEEMIRYRTIANNLALVAVLIATVTFAAAFTLPGGYKGDGGPNEGAAILTKKIAFKVFILSDTLAMVSSIIITCLLIHTGSWDHDVRLHSIDTSIGLMRLAIGAMVVAFATGTYAVVSGDSLGLAILVCVMVCSVPIAVYSIAFWPLGYSDFAESCHYYLKKTRSCVLKKLCFFGSQKIAVDVTTAVLRFPPKNYVTNFTSPQSSAE